MKLLPFKESKTASIGIELEFQIIDPNSFSLISRSKELIRNIKESIYNEQIKPEVTQSMIEINTSIHHSVKEMLDELQDIQQFLLREAAELNILFCGGGAHPFQKWAMQKIFPSMRYKTLSHKYRYLSKRSTVFGQHIHIGCKNAEDALYLTHALTRYVPHFVAITAASPFYQGVDTGYQSTRLTDFSSFPTSGVIPYLTTWKEFSNYYYKLRQVKIISSMKDFYWDIRPKPEFGTVEIRICDTPLSLRKAAIITAYVQALSLYLLEEKPITISQDLYYLYNYNRFEASRYGFDGKLVDPHSYKQCLIIDDIYETLKIIEGYTNRLNNLPYTAQLVDDLISKSNDASLLRQLVKQHGSYAKVVQEQCKIWSQPNMELP